MNDDIYDDLAIEQACKTKFGMVLDIADVIVRAAPVAVTAQATLFKTTSGQVMLFIASQAAQVLDDVHKIVLRMNLEADQFLPPNAEAGYFDRIGRDKYKVMFPGKAIRSEDDLRYYKNLSPYNPALVRIAKIKGEVRAYDMQSRIWRKVKEYSFTKIKTV